MTAPSFEQTTDFFDPYPQFLSTSSTGAVANRLNKRYQAIYQHKQDLFEGKTVLDISSHDGRWSFAALKTGAAHVVGIEPRPHLVANANATLSELGYKKDDQFKFIQGDVFEVLHNMSFDIVMCLGFMYHTYRHPELMKLMKKCNPQHLIIDTQVHPLQGPLCIVRADEVGNEFEAWSEKSSYMSKTVVAMPTADLVRQLMDIYDFDCETVDWAPLLLDGNEVGVKDYAENKRATFFGTSR